MSEMENLAIDADMGLKRIASIIEDAQRYNREYGVLKLYDEEVQNLLQAVKMVREDVSELADEAYELVEQVGDVGQER